MDTVSFDCGEFTNRLKRGNVNGKKVDESSEPLSGAIFGLFAKNCKSFTAQSAIKTAESNEDGCFSFTDIPFGEYFIKEIASPSGYILSSESFPVVIDEDGDVVEIIAENKPITIEISKRDVYGNELAGAEMELVNEDGEVIEKWISDGSNHVITAIATGRYILQETAAPDGYVLAAEIRFSVDEYGKAVAENVDTMAFSNDGNPLIVMVDEATCVKIYKCDSENGDQLVGASMQVLDEAGNIVVEWVSDGTPYEMDAILTAGATYTLREIEAPEGYELSDDVIFTVSDDGKIDEITMLDSPIPVPPTSKTGDDSSKLPGVVMVTVGLVVFAALFISRKKKTGETTDFAELCPDFVEVDDEK